MRNKEQIREEYNRWMNETSQDTESPVAGDVHKELEGMNETEIEDAFYRDLAFGTGGLRSTIGAGTNRMNKYTVAKASQGLANYVNANYPDNLFDSNCI